MTPSPKLDPVEAHTALVDHLQQVESGLWRAFAASDSLEGLAEATRLELLKNTVRLSPSSHPRAYAAATQAAEALGLAVPVTVYQGPAAHGTNASLFFVPEEAHVVLMGPILERLDDEELRALFGHELAHHGLWTRDSARFWIADRLLDANAAHPSADPSHLLTAERFQLFTELFADRGSAIAAGSPDPAIRCLLKVQTGLADPDVGAYREQVADVFADGPLASDGGTHPEGFIRVRALDAWWNGEPEIIEPLIKGPLRIEALDCVDQTVVEGWTKSLLAAQLRHPWMRTEATIGQARLIWTDLDETQLGLGPGPDLTPLRTTGAGLTDYWCYLLLDLAVADRELDELGLLAGLLTAEDLEIRERFGELAHTELKVPKRRLQELWDEREALAEKAAAALAAEPEAEA